MVDLCIQCKERPIHNVKRGLCQSCYQRDRRVNGPYIKFDHTFCDRVESQKNDSREIVFIKKFFSHHNWVHEPAKFKIDDTSYTPDFYDGERDVWIEVAGTRQAFEANKDKYLKFREAYPKLNFEVRRYDGVLLDLDNDRQCWV
jgi:hypothetical protein